MKITYDKQADALYIRLLEREHQCRVVRLTDDIAPGLCSRRAARGRGNPRREPLVDEAEEPTVELKDLLPRIVTA